MTAVVQPHREPLRATLIRNTLLAVIAGTVLAISSRRSAAPIGWPVAVVLMFWPTFGGHWVELCYLEWVKPRLPVIPSMQRAARLITWFLGGCILAAGAQLTARALGAPTRWPAWWFGGVVFVGLELVVHVALQLRGQSSFFNDRN